MNVREFIDNYKENPATLEELEVKHYIPCAVKINAIDGIQQRLVHENTEGLTTFSSIEKYFLFIMTVINLYTELEIGSPVTDDYDLLAEHGLVRKIIDKIGSDYYDFMELLDMRWTDIIRDNNTIEASVNRVLGAMQLGMQEAINQIAASMLGSSSLNNEDASKLIQNLFTK